jgi:hypothetical protein
MANEGLQNPRPDVGEHSCKGHSPACSDCPIQCLVMQRLWADGYPGNPGYPGSLTSPGP